MLIHHNANRQVCPPQSKMCVCVSHSTLQKRRGFKEPFSASVVECKLAASISDPKHIFTVVELGSIIKNLIPGGLCGNGKWTGRLTPRCVVTVS